MFALPACDPYVQGNGVYYEEHRSVAPFAGLRVEDGIDAIVTAQAAQQDVLVSGDANVVPYIRTEVEDQPGQGQVLHAWVDLSGGFSRIIPPRTVIQVSELKYVDAIQGSSVKVSAAATPIFTVVASEGSTMELDGPGLDVAAGHAIDVTLSTGAALNATEYVVSQTADVDLTGASTARLHCEGPVTGTVAGGSRLDNLVGAGSCDLVTKDATSTVQCQPLP